jgi:hypothetical protein
VEERERRIGLNEALFREVNERLEELARGFAHTPQKLDLICECGNASCASRIEMDREEYEQVRSDSATFAIVKGHAVPVAAPLSSASLDDSRTSTDWHRFAFAVWSASSFTPTL